MLYQPTAVDKAWPFIIIPLMVLLFIALSQPVWRGKEMVAEFKDNCSKRGGVLLENKKMFGTEYQCASRLD